VISVINAEFVLNIYRFLFNVTGFAELYNCKYNFRCFDVVVIQVYSR
jgi:hypothetical protein